MKSILVIGGANYDITGKITADTIPADSNPGLIRGSCGGVGRNIAENLARLGVPVSLLTAFGDDSFSSILKNACEDIGLDISHCLTVENAAAGIYLSILDSAGELALAVNDMTALNALNAEKIKQETDYIASFPYVFADANLPEETLLAVGEVCKGVLFAEGVSVKKVTHLKGILPRVHTLKVNRAELSALSGLSAENTGEIQAAAEALRSQGAKRVFVTLGKQGAACLTENGYFTAPAEKVQVINVTGAGDAFAAALAYGTMKELPEQEILRLGTRAAAIALSSPSANSSRLSEETLLK